MYVQKNTALNAQYFNFFKYRAMLDHLNLAHNSRQDAGFPATIYHNNNQFFCAILYIKYTLGEVGIIGNVAVVNQ